jgi:nucleotide-binding universal stress UspA family protein
MNTALSHPHAIAEPPAAEGAAEFYAGNQWLDCAQRESDRQNEKQPTFGLKTILVPLTLSNGSYTTLAIAKDLAAKSNAKLVLLHVVQLNIVGEECGIPRARLFDELCHSAETQLHELASCMGDQATAEVLVCVGRPAEAIVETARRLEAYAIVMRLHRHRRWLRWLHRRTGLTVVRQAPCRIWLVTPGEHAETVNLMIVDHTRMNQISERVAIREEKNPFRSLLRIPFF